MPDYYIKYLLLIVLLGIILTYGKIIEHDIKQHENHQHGYDNHKHEHENVKNKHEDHKFKKEQLVKYKIVGNEQTNCDYNKYTIGENRIDYNYSEESKEIVNSVHEREWNKALYNSIAEKIRTKKRQERTNSTVNIYTRMFI